MSRIARAGCVGSRTSSFLPRPYDSGNGASGQNFRRFSALAALALRSVRPATENRSFKNHGASGEEFGNRPPAGCRCMARRGGGGGVKAFARISLAAALATFAAAPALAHNGAPDWHQRLYNPHMLDQPRIVSRPAAGDTYYPGETITVYVPWGRTQTRTSISVNSVGTVQLVLTVGGAQRTLTGIWEDRSSRYGPAFTIRRLYFDYVVQVGDRDTDGVSLAENALSSPGSAESGIRGTAGTSFRQFELEKLLHGFGAQSGHKVDTPAPSFSGVSSPSLTLYTCGPFDDCGSASHRLPTISNASRAHNVSYSVTSALPAGLSVNASTAAITGSHNGWTTRRNYTLRATDGFSRTADLTFSLEVRDGAGVESIAVTSNPGSDRTYGKNGDFGTNDTITVRVDFNRPIGTIIRRNVCLKIRVGGNTRSACNPTGAARQDKLHFSYAVVESDWDGDGISFPANPMGAGKDGNLRFYRVGIGGGDNRIDRSFGAVLDDPNHKVRGRQTTPSFGAIASPSFSWVKDNAVSQALPAATGGDGGLTYSVKEGLPDGLVFTAATRTLSGTPTAVQGAASYTLVATDGDGDKAELRFSIEIREIVLSISSPSVAEGAAGEMAALPFAVTLNRAPGRQVTVDWAADADPGTAVSGADYTAFSGGALTFSAAETSKTVEVAVTGDALDEPDETIRIALSNPSGAVLGSAAATGVGTITDDDPTPTLSLSLSDPDAGRPDTIRESGAGNATTVTASLSGGTSGEAITVTVSAASTYAALAADGGFGLSAARTLTIAAGQAASAGAVTITATDDAIDSADKTATVSGAVAGGHGLVAAPVDLTLTIADEDSRPSSALALAPASISESGGVATVTATLSHPSAEAVTIAVSATASTGAVDGDFSLSAANALTVAAGRTTSAGVVTVTAVGNGTDSPDKQVTVKGSASGALGAADPPDATLTLRDDDGPPTVSLVLSSSSIAENGGVATVSAALGGPSSEAVTVTVAAAAVAASGAAAGDFGLSGDATLTIAANATASTGTVTITASDNDVDSPDKRVTVSGAATGGNGVTDPASVTLTLADDEALPTATLALQPASIAEAGGLSTVTATLSGKSSAALTLTVAAAAGANAADGDFTLSAATTLTIAAGETTSAGVVTVTANADTTDSPDKLVAVGAAAAGGNGVADPAAATLTIADDDALPTLTLTLSPSTIDESGTGSTATVTAALSHPSSAVTTITVSAVAVSPADAGDFSLSAANTLTIAAGDTVSAGAVTVAAVDDSADTPDKRVTVRGAAAGGHGLANPADATLAIADDDAAPTVTLTVADGSIAESGGATSVSATLSHPSSAATTVTVTAVAGTYTVASGAGATIVIAAGRMANAADTATIAAVDDDVHQGSGGRSTTVTGTASNDQGAGAVTGAALTLTDDETLPTVAFVLSSSSISETGGVSTVMATLSGPSSAAVTVTVAATVGADAVAGDFTLSTATTLTIAAGSTTSAGVVTVTANGNVVDSPNKSVTVSGTAAGGNGVANPPNAALTLTDDDALPTVALALSSTSISETGGVSTVTATLSGKSSAAVTITVGAAAGTGAIAADFDLSSAATLTIAAGSTTSVGTVTVTANGNVVDSPDKSVTVSGAAAGGNGVADPPNVTLTLTDDDVLPTVALALSDSSISETDGVSTVTATLSGKSSAAVTVTVAAVAGAGAVAGDFMQSGTTLTIAAGATTSAGVVTVTANGNAVDSPDKSVTISGTAAGGNGVADPSNVTLTLEDDDTLPTVALALSDSSISETGGVSTVTATLSGKSSAAVTVTVTAVAGAGAVAEDFTQSGTTLTIAAGATTSAGVVTVTSNGNAVDSPDKSVTISGTAAGGNGVANPPNVTLTLTDDETLPTVALVLSSSSISETGGVSTVTATLSGKSSAAVTITVGAAAGTGAVAADFDLSSAATLTIAAGATTSAGLVTVTANGNAVDSPNKSVTVSGAAAGGNSVANPPNATLTLTDDETLPTVALVLSSSSISETGGVSTVTATLSGKSSAAVTVTVAAVAGTGAVAADFALSNAATLTIAAGSTTSAGLVTVTANGNAVDSPNKSVTVSGTAAGGNGVANPPNVTLTLTDDDALPTVALKLSDSSISETGGVSTVMATLSGASSAAVTVTVAAVAGIGAVAADFALSIAATLTIAAGSTTSAGLVTVTANGNAVDSPNKSVTVSGTAAGGNGVANPPNVTLTLTDDDALPMVALALSSTSISETGGISTVMATLSGKSSAAVTITVGAAAGADAVAADFDLSSAATLTIAAGATTSAGLVTVTANGNDVDSPNKSVTVSGTAAGGNGVANPPNAVLTLTDDDALPTVALALSSISILETGGVSTVTATLSGKSSAAVTITVGAAAGTGAVAADFDLSSAATLTIAAGATTSAGTVTVTANGNAVDSPNKSVTVSGAAAGGNGVANPPNATLTLEDDDALPTVALALTPSTVGENGGISTVTATLSGASSAAVTLTVSAAAVASTGAVAGDFALSSATTLTIAAGATTSAGLMTVTAQDNAADEPDIEVRVSATAAGGNGVAAPPAATLTIRDDEGPPTVTLALTPSTIDESGTGSTAAVTATLNRASSAATTITVSVAPVASTGAAAGDYALSSAATLTVAAGATTSSGTVTIAAVDNDTDAPNRQATVSGTAVNDQSVQQPVARTLTIADDDAAPDVTLALSASSISENGGVTTVTATLNRRSAQATTVTVQAAAGAYSVGSAARIVIAAGATTSADKAALAAVDNDVDAADRQVTVTAALTNGHGAGTVSGGGVSLTLTDDDTAGIAVSPATSTGSRLETTESAGTATFTVKLATEPTGDVEIGVASSDTAEGTVDTDSMANGNQSGLTFTASDWNAAQTVTLTGVDDSNVDGNRDYTVTLTIDQTNTADAKYDALPAVTVYATNRDNEFGLNVSAVTGQATEGGGQSTFTVALRTQPTAAVTVSVASRDASEGRVEPSSLTFATTSWNTAQTVTVTGANDTIDDGTVTWAVRLDPASGDSDYNALSVEEDVSVTTTDDDGPPGVTLTLNPASVAESGTGNAATVSARLSHPSGAATTVTVTGVSGFYAAGTDAAIVIPAGSAQAATDTATVVAVDNATDAPDRTETVTASIANDRATADGTTMSVTGASLTVRDDELAPTAALSLDPASVSENGGVSTVTATLSHPSSQPSTVTVTAVSGAYTVGTDATITIAAGSTTAASDTVLVTAVDDDIHQGSAGRGATVTAALANGQGAGAATGAALTLTDDETLPVATLHLSSASIAEAGGVSTVTARLSGPSSAAVTVTVSTASSSAYAQTGSTLTIAAGSTTSAGAVTVRGNDDTVASGSRQVAVSGTATGGNGVASPADATLTITDDDAPQTTLALSSSSVSENGGVATVTATLDRQSTVAVTVTVAAAAGANAAAGDFALSAATTLTFAANATTSAGLVTVTAVNDATDAPNKSVTVSGTAADSLGLTNDPASVTLTLTDDEGAPGVTLSLNPASVSENGGTSAVSATLSHPSSQPSTVTVTAVSGAYAVGSGAAGTIVIAAGATTAATDTATVTAVDDDVHQGSAGRSATVTATLANGQGAGAVTGAALALTDDETLPTATLILGPTSISEDSGISTVTARLSGPSSAATTVTVSSSAVASSGAVAADFTQSGTTLTIAAGATASAGTVTVRGNDNDVDADNKQVTVSATAAGGNGVAAPSPATLTLTDDEATATATLVLTPAAILENREVSTVTARLSHPTTEATTLTVTTTPVFPAVAGDFTRSGTNTLTIAAGATTSAGLVTITSVDNAVASGRKQVTVSATASGGRMVASPSDATLTIRDDEFGLDESAVTGQATEGGGTATFTVALQTQPSAAVTVTVSSRDADGNPDATEGRVAPSTLIFTAQNWETAQTVTVTGADDDVDDGDAAWKVRLDPSSGDVNYDGLDDVDVNVTTTDDDGAPGVTLTLDPASIPENGGVSTVTAALSHPSSEDTTVTVTASPVSPAVTDDFTLSTAATLTIAAGSVSSAGVVTITAEDDDVDAAADKTVTVLATVANDRATADGTTVTVTEAKLTIADDDEAGFAFDPEETVLATADADAAYTIKLTSEPAGTVTVTVTTSPDDADLTASPDRLTFAPSDWETARTVTVTAQSDDDDLADTATLTHQASGGGYGGVTETLDVAVDSDDTKIRVREGTKTYRINGRRVTTVMESGVPTGIEIDLADLPGVASNEGLTLTFAPVESPAASDKFAYGVEESRTVVDVTVTEGTVRSPGLRLCLPVTTDLREAARGRQLLLLHYDGRDWTQVVRSALNAERTHVCAPGVASFSPFAVGYEDTAPTFGDFAMTEMVFTVGEDIGRKELPKATGGDRTDHELLPKPWVLPRGLTFDEETGVLSGTPEETFPKKDYTWTATDIDREKAELKFSIEVIPALEEARARLKAINESILPELSRATWGSAVDAVTGRLASPGMGGGVLASGLAGAASVLRSNERALEEGAASWKDLLAGESFAVGLGPGAGSAAVAWGSGERRRLSLDKEALDWSGDLFSAHMGVDAPLGGGLRGGLAASWFEGEIEYADRSGEAAIAGVHESRLTAAHPYLGWSGPDGSRLWGVMGYGEGKIEITDAEVAERFGVQKGDSAFAAAAAGGSVPVLSADGLALALKASGEATRYSVEDNGSAIAAAAAKTQRLRLAAEGTRTYALPDGGTLSPSLEAGARWDGGDGETGLGVEVGGGLSWASDSLSVEVRGRALAAHEGDVEEWGAAGSARLSPGFGGRGLSLSLSPGWGASESGLARLWDDGAAASGGGARLEADLGYGFRIWAGLATPRAGFNYEESGQRRWRLGTRFEFRPGLALDVEAERKEGVADPEHGVRLELRVRW